MAQLELFPGQAHAFKLNLNSDQKARLQARLRLYSSYNLGPDDDEIEDDAIETRKRCIVTVKLKSADTVDDYNLVEDLCVVLRVYVVAFMLKFDFYPEVDWLISHICGNGRCIETSHMEVADRALNRQRIVCHDEIDKFVANAKLHPETYSESDRTGTVFCYTCEHTPTCFKNI